MGIELHYAKGLARARGLGGQGTQGAQGHGMLTAQDDGQGLAVQGMGRGGLDALQHGPDGGVTVHGRGRVQARFSRGADAVPGLQLLRGGQDGGRPAGGTAAVGDALLQRDGDDVEGGLFRPGRFVFRGQETAFVEFLMTDGVGAGHARVSRQKNGLLGGQAVSVELSVRKEGT